MRKLPFQRLCREIQRDLADEALTPQQATNRDNMRWKGEAILALQYATEMYATEVFEMAQLACIHAKRITIKSKDIELARKLSKYNTWAEQNIGIGDWSDIRKDCIGFSTRHYPPRNPS